MALFLFSGVTTVSVNAQDAKKRFTLPTPWTEEAMNAETPLPEYPRPQLVRAQWLNLNGEWDYMTDPGGVSPVKASAPPSFTKGVRKIRFRPNQSCQALPTRATPACGTAVLSPFQRNGKASA